MGSFVMIYALRPLSLASALRLSITTAAQSARVMCTNVAGNYYLRVYLAKIWFRIALILISLTHNKDKKGRKLGLRRKCSIIVKVNVKDTKDELELD